MNAGGAVDAGAEGFAYDNERPRHAVETPAFRIARRPVTCGSWMRFADEDSQYVRERTLPVREAVAIAGWRCWHL